MSSLTCDNLCPEAKENGKCWARSSPWRSSPSGPSSRCLGTSLESESVTVLAAQMFLDGDSQDIQSSFPSMSFVLLLTVVWVKVSYPPEDKRRSLCLSLSRQRSDRASSVYSSRGPGYNIVRWILAPGRFPYQLDNINLIDISPAACPPGCGSSAQSSDPVQLQSIQLLTRPFHSHV